MFNWSFLVKILPQFPGAIGTTVLLSFFAILAPSVIGLIFLCLSRTGRAGNAVAQTVSWIFKATPILVLLYFLYYGLPSWGLTYPAFWLAVVAFGISTFPYDYEIFRSGLNAVPRSQVEAAYALGLSRHRVWLRVIIPQAWGVILPAWISNATRGVKGTSIASLVAIHELTDAATLVISNDYRVFEPIAVVAVVYLALNSVLTGAQRLFERRIRRWSAGVL
jgi:His/Glu/Gln/Arg/opine family amino acid ABC transporter permease subunit